MLLLKNDTIKKRSLEKKTVELEFNSRDRGNSGIYKIEVICDSAAYTQ